MKDAIVVELGVHMRHGAWWYYEHCDCLRCQRRREKDRQMKKERRQDKHIRRALIILSGLMIGGSVMFILGRLVGLWFLK